ncbi:hypothetical protein AYJ54_14720 [Bradyrhizobium centrolobii]|uniref:Uncharacterized protein n=1 Tax=Bradyrhizobium centrolobii TaxID=1505087 RepID=A0A176YQ95_9BRAD|nr:hypothetical protein AYJ54_14720 [Bradyrhizobium centrolobii]
MVFPVSKAGQLCGRGKIHGCEFLIETPLIVRPRGEIKAHSERRHQRLTNLLLDASKGTR